MSVPIVTIFGGSGFIGRYVAQRMARAGWRVRVAVRRPNEAHFVRPYGVVGQVEPIQANIRDEASTRRVIRGADAVVNCVGVLAESGKQTFDALMDQGAARIARIAAEEGVGAARPHLGDRRRSGERQPLRRRQGPRRGGGPRRLPGRGDPAALGRLRGRGRLLQQVRRDGPDPAGAAARRARHPVPAGLRRRRRRRGRRRRDRGRRAGRLRARRARGRDLPRADAADAEDHLSPADARRPALRACPDPGRLPRLPAARERRALHQHARHPRPAAPARPRQRRLAGDARAARARHPPDRDGRGARELSLRLPAARPVRRDRPPPPATCARGPELGHPRACWSPPSSACSKG